MRLPKCLNIGKYCISFAKHDAYPQIVVLSRLMDLTPFVKSVTLLTRKINGLSRTKAGRYDILIKSILRRQILYDSIYRYQNFYNDIFEISKHHFMLTIVTGQL